MFDKILFDRNAYDRSVSDDSISGIIMGTSSFKISVIIAYPIPLRSFSGTGDLKPGLRMRANVGIPMSGEGDINEIPLILRLPLSCKMSGSGNMDSKLNVQTPLGAMIFSGVGNMISERDFVYQHLVFTLSGRGEFNNNIYMQKPLGDVIFAGIGNLTGKMVLKVPLSVSMEGTSTFELRRLSALNESILELDGITLQPGESITIDTDLLTVLFGHREDVSAVTKDSVFFELSPGENDITIETDSNSQINVTAIWQNRWL